MIPFTQPPKAENVSEEKKPVRNLQELMRQKAMKSVADFNKQLNKERIEERPCSMDLQSYTINYPVGLGINHKQYQKCWKKYGEWTPKRKVFNYPVALVPEQYQDYYDNYSSVKLTQLPLHKAKIFPEIDKDKLPRNLAPMQINDYYDLSDPDDDIENCDCHIDDISKKVEPEVVNNDDVFLAALKEKLKSGSTNSISGSTPGQAMGQSTTKPGIIASLSATLTNNVPLNIPTGLGPIDPNDCKICKTSMTLGSLLKCSDCGVASHATCLDITGELLEAIRLYSWQCTECKVCTQCRQPHDEEKMMFCDKCDRGYHTYCVGLAAIPDGHWVCSLCAVCALCGTKTLAKINDSLTDWQHELITLHSPDGQKLVRHQVYCYSCHQKRKK